MEENFWESSGWRRIERVAGWECLYFHRKLQLFLSVYVDDIEMAGKTQNNARDVGKLAKESRLGRPSITHGWGISLMFSASSTSQNWGDKSQRRHGRSRSSVWLTPLRIGAQDGWPISWMFWRSPNETRRSGNCWRFVRDSLSDCVEMLVLGKNWKTRSTLDRKSLGKISYKVNRACALRQARLTSYVHHKNHQQRVLSRWTFSIRLQTGIFPRRRIFKEIWEIQIQFQVVCSVPIWITYVCADFSAWKKEICVSHSGTEAGMKSRDAGLRMEGIPAINFWDAKHRHFAPASWRRLQAYWANTKTKTSRSAWRHGILTYKRAVIQHANGITHLRRHQSCDKTKNKGRSPTMRHVPCTHGVDLDG